jgi:tetratricopeptide (TPR) repeat protein
MSPQVLGQAHIGRVRLRREDQVGQLVLQAATGHGQTVRADSPRRVAVAQVQADRLNLEDTDCYNCRGSSYTGNQDYSKAVKDHDEAIRLDSNDPKGFSGRGIACGGLGDDQKAIKDYTEAIRLDSKDADFYYLRALSYKNLKEIKKAIGDYKVANRLNPKKYPIDYLRDLKPPQ